MQLFGSCTTACWKFLTGASFRVRLGSNLSHSDWSFRLGVCSLHVLSPLGLKEVFIMVSPPQESLCTTAEVSPHCEVGNGLTKESLRTIAEVSPHGEVGNTCCLCQAGTGLPKEFLLWDTRSISLLEPNICVGLYGCLCV